MPDIYDDKGIKAIAFYLPQYHPIPENDKAWGKGFTEWTNVKKAQPLFEGHNQPRVPLNNKYYNLLDDNVMAEQAALARKYGVYGFCYYHYWFKNGKKLLEKPLEKMLLDKKIDIPFCLSWANENWTRKWDGGDAEIIAEQDYGDKSDWEKHFLYLVDFFTDNRYITIHGKPLLLIYRPTLIPNVQEMLKYWNKRSTECGFEGICFMVQNGSAYFEPIFDMGIFSYQIKFEPFFSNTLIERPEWISKKKKMDVLKKLHVFKPIYYFYNKIRKNKKKPSFEKKQKTIDYDAVWNNILKENCSDFLIEGACVDWDNTPRTPFGYRMEGVSSDKFEDYFCRLVKKIKEKDEVPVVFINAWNEWGEGAYLEPDTKNEYAYLEAVKKAIWD